MKKQYDILVFGGGTGGVSAALQAARAGCSVLLAEKNAGPGGTISNSRITVSGLYHAWGRQIIAGIGWELATECTALAGLSLPDFTRQDDEHVFNAQIRLNPVLFSLLCEEKLERAGVDRSYHTMAASVSDTGNAWNTVLCTIEGLQNVKANIVIDCTGDASVAGLAGFTRNLPDPCQPGTLCAGLSGYSPEALDLTALERAVTCAVHAGELRYTDLGWRDDRPDLRILKNMGDNGNHIAGKRLFTSEGRTTLEIEARMSLLRLFRFCKKQKGLESIRMDCSAAECGVRESATILGEHVIAKEEYLNAVSYPDAVCHAFYPLDLHGGAISSPMKDRLPRRGCVPSVPLRALIPRKSRNFLIAGRCISSDREANSALRVQAAVMATGQAAGAAAVLAVRSGSTPAEVSLSGLKQILSDHGAIVPPVQTK